MVKHKLRARHAQHTYFTSAFVTILKPRHNQKQPKITTGQNDLSFTPRSLRGLKMTRVLMRIAGRVHLNTHAEYKISCSSFLCSCLHSSFLLPTKMKWTPDPNKHEVVQQVCVTLCICSWCMRVVYNNLLRGYQTDISMRLACSSEICCGPEDTFCRYVIY